MECEHTQWGLTDFLTKTMQLLHGFNPFVIML